VKWNVLELTEFDWVEADNKADAGKLAQLLWPNRARAVQAVLPPSVRSAQSYLPP
jgi:hypothetical protein